MRLEAGAADLFQIRWESCKKPPHDLVARTDRYLTGLQNAAKKRKQRLTYTKHEQSLDVDFKWNSEAKGVGRMLYDSGSSRIFILERSGGKGSSIVAETNRTMDSFRTYEGVLPWSVLGFRVDLPEEFQLEKFKFLTGRATLHFKAKGIDLTAERWSLADAILKKHSLQDWAEGLIGKGVLADLNTAPVESEGVRLTIKPKLPAGKMTEAIIRHDPVGNRLLVLKAFHRKRPPKAEWLA